LITSRTTSNTRQLINVTLKEFTKNLQHWDDFVMAKDLLAIALANIISYQEEGASFQQFQPNNS
jgi:hypothetical protein